MDETLLRKSLWYGVVFSLILPLMLFLLLATGDMAWFKFEHSYAWLLKIILLVSLAIQLVTVREFFVFPKRSVLRVLA